MSVSGRAPLTKVCATCRCRKYLREFYKASRGGGYRGECRSCFLAADRKRKAARRCMNCGKRSRFRRCVACRTEYQATHMAVLAQSPPGPERCPTCRGMLLYQVDRAGHAATWCSRCGEQAIPVIRPRLADGQPNPAYPQPRESAA